MLWSMRSVLRWSLAAGVIVGALCASASVWGLGDHDSRASDGRSAVPAVGDPRRIEIVEVPRVVGVDDSFARRLIAETHLRLGEVRLEPSDAPWGSVIYQSVSAGSSVPTGTAIDLVIAKGSVPQPCRLYWCATGDGWALDDATAD